MRRREVGEVREVVVVEEEEGGREVSFEVEELLEM